MKKINKKNITYNGKLSKICAGKATKKKEEKKNIYIYIYTYIYISYWKLQENIEKYWSDTGLDWAI